MATVLVVRVENGIVEPRILSKTSMASGGADGGLGLLMALRSLDFGEEVMR